MRQYIALTVLLTACGSSPATQPSSVDVPAPAVRIPAAAPAAIVPTPTPTLTALSIDPKSSSFFYGYHHQYYAAGGTPPYTWTVSSAAGLPGSVDSNGMYLAKPYGTASVVVTVTDSTGVYASAQADIFCGASDPTCTKQCVWQCDPLTIATFGANSCTVFTSPYTNTPQCGCSGCVTDPGHHPTCPGLPSDAVCL